jgi:iron-sulfur cluster repair protein YtfE (RIC family)
MTEPSQALEELVRQHEMLRAMMEACEQLADNVDRGRGEVGALVREVAKLRERFEAHNQFEEHVLRPILRTLDAFGDVRVEYMVADHIGEHRALCHRLDGPTAELRAVLHELRAHLAGEERWFLSAHVLRDDVITIEPTG